MQGVPGFRQSWIRAGVGLLIGAVFFALVLRQTSWAQVQSILLGAGRQWLVLAIAFYAISMILRVERWRGLLWDVKPLSRKSVGIALVIGYAMNNILPARLGELFRADFAGQRYHLSRSAVIGSIALERTLDGLIVVLSLVLGRFFIAQRSPQVVILNGLILGGFALFFSVAVVLWFLSTRSHFQWIDRVPESIGRRIISFRQGLGALRSTQLVRLVVLSIVVWIFEAFAHWSVLSAIQVSLNWQQMLSVVGVVNLSTLIPSAPGFAGTYQYAYALVLGLFDYDAALGIAAATAVQIFLLGSATLVGLGLLIWINAQSLARERSLHQQNLPSDPDSDPPEAISQPDKH